MPRIMSQRRKGGLQSLEVVKTVDFSFPATASEGEARFRVDILRHGDKKYTAKLWHLESCRIQLTFSEDESTDEEGHPLSGPQKDEQLLVQDVDMVHGLSGSSPSAVLKKVTHALQRHLALQPEARPLKA